MINASSVIFLKEKTLIAVINVKLIIQQMMKKYFIVKNVKNALKSKQIYFIVMHVISAIQIKEENFVKNVKIVIMINLIIIAINVKLAIILR